MLAAAAMVGTAMAGSLGTNAYEITNPGYSKQLIHYLRGNFRHAVSPPPRPNQARRRRNARWQRSNRYCKKSR